MAGVIVADDIDWNRYMQDSEPAARVRPASAYRDLVVERFENAGKPNGALLPWAKTHEHFAMRPGELTVWAGINGHGKSLLLGHVMLGLMQQEQRCMIASFEMRPEVTLHRMCRQASQGLRPTLQFIDAFHRWTDSRLWLYDQQGQVDPLRIIAVLRYCHERLQMRHVVIDSLMKCIRGEDDYNGQKNLLDTLTSVARDTGMHVHLVHHSKKREDESKAPGKFDLKGSGSISDQADNVMIVWRNKKKQMDMQHGDGDPDAPDAMLVCEKQRNGEWEGRIALWFDAASQQYIGAAGGRTQEYVR
ncbi:MAG: DnaB-like helicase C-terminal domain-containing protein [Leptolyngbyaceae bacterium]|nr:DnaB-like helicase C-terminal domain-containing protein [Leptolyngbyaceae bacterium]